MFGILPGAKATSRTGPMIWVIRPTFLVLTDVFIVKRGKGFVVVGLVGCNHQQNYASRMMHRQPRVSVTRSRIEGTWIIHRCFGLLAGLTSLRGMLGLQIVPSLRWAKIHI